MPQLQRYILFSFFFATLIMLFLGLSLYVMPIQRTEDSTHEESHPFSCQVHRGELREQPGYVRQSPQLIDWWLEITVELYDGTIDFALVNQTEYDKWKSDYTFTFIFSSENTSHNTYTLERPSKGIYYFLLDNTRYETSKRVYLTVSFYEKLPNYDLANTFLGAYFLLVSSFLLVVVLALADRWYKIFSKYLTFELFPGVKYSNIGHLTSLLTRVIFWGLLLIPLLLSFATISIDILELQGPEVWPETRLFFEEAFLRVFFDDFALILLSCFLYLVINLTFIQATKKISWKYFRSDLNHKKLLWTDFVNRLLSKTTSRLFLTFLGMLSCLSVLFTISFLDPWIIFMLCAIFSSQFIAYVTSVCYKESCENFKLNWNNELESDTPFVLIQTSMFLWLIPSLLSLFVAFPFIAFSYQKTLWGNSPLVQWYPEFLDFVSAQNTLLSSIIISTISYFTMFSWIFSLGFGIGFVELFRKILRDSSWNTIKDVLISIGIFLLVFCATQVFITMIHSTIATKFAQAFALLLSILSALISWFTRRAISTTRKKRHLSAFAGENAHT